MAIYARLSTQFWTDPKVLGVSALAELLYVRTIAYCVEQLNGGHFPANVLVHLGLKMPPNRLVRFAKELVEVGLWEDLDGNYRFPPETWARWQTSREDVLARRQAESDRKAEWRKRRGRPSPSVADADVPRDTNGTDVIATDPRLSSTQLSSNSTPTQLSSEREMDLSLSPPSPSLAAQMNGLGESMNLDRELER